MGISNGVNSDRSVKPDSRKRIRRWLRRGLILALCLWLFSYLMGRALRQIAVGQIVELTGAKVESESVDVGLDGSVFIEKLVVRSHKEQRRDDAILKAGRVYARFGIGSLLILRPRLKEISVKDFVFDAQYDLDTGQWNIAALEIKTPKGGSGKMPLVHLERGTLRYSKISKGQVKVAAEIPVEVRFGPSEELSDAYRFNITTAKRPGFGKSTLTGFWRPGDVTVWGAISSADVAAFERSWMINVLAAELKYDQDNTYSMTMRIKDLVSTHRPAGGTFALETRALLEKYKPFAALQRFFSRYRPAGRIDIELEASGNLYQLGKSTLRGKVYCRDVSICDRRFPYTVEHIVGQVGFTEKGAELNNLRGEHGDVKLAFNGWSKDFGPKWQYDIGLTSDNMALDNDLYDALNAKQKKFWSVFSPSGVAAINYRMVMQSQTDKKKTLAVELLGTEAAYRHFPYPLKNLSGRLLFEPDDITFSDVVSQFGGRKITINGKVAGQNTDRPIYEFGISARDIPLDSTLGASLSERERYLYNRLNMAGLADAEIKVLTSKGEPAGAGITANISVKEGFLKPDDFPLAISDVSAKTVITRDLIHVENLTGSCGESSVSLTGRIWPGAEAEEFRYGLALRAEQAQLNDDLFGLLPGSLKEVVRELQPKGKINYTVDLNKAAGADAPDCTITVDCLGDSFDFEPFPFPLKNITGTLTITTKRIKPQSIVVGNNAESASGATTVKISGRMAQTDDDFSNGRFDLDLESIKIFDVDMGGKYIDFAGVAKFEGCNLSIWPSITEVDGVLKIRGLYKTGEGFSDGEAALFADSLRIKGKPLTELKADIYYDDSRQSWVTKSLVAKCCGGSLTGKFEFKQPVDKSSEYLLQVGFDGINLKQFLGDRTAFCGDSEREEGYLGTLSETKPKELFDTSGKLSGSLSIAGQMIGDDHSRLGRCRLTMSDMHVGRLSPLVKLLCVLKLTDPKDFAFDEMFVDSYIMHNRVFLEQLDWSGEAVAFNGSGWIDLASRNVDLVLFGRGPRLAAAEPSIFQSLTESIGSGVVRMEVTGDFCEPKVTIKTLPVIEGTLEILGTPR
ncbi:MAG: AsmA family protein [Planctomycetota bacterium]|jgi:hypothetical protein